MQKGAKERPMGVPYTVWSRILEKLAVRQLVKMSHFIELECSSPCSQETAIYTVLLLQLETTFA